MYKNLKYSFIIFALSFNAHADLGEAVNALINQNYVTAIPLLKRLAEQGDPNAQYNLAIVYQKGLGVKADVDKSNSYFSNSAHLGLVDSYRTLSVASIKPISVDSPLVGALPAASNLEPRAWVKSQNSNYYTLQLASSTNARLIQKYFIENGLAGKAGYYKNKREGEDWYALIYGSYPSVKLANKAISSLPKDLRKWSPWVRKLGSIQRIMID